MTVQQCYNRQIRVCEWSPSGFPGVGKGVLPEFFGYAVNLLSEEFVVNGSLSVGRTYQRPLGWRGFVTVDTDLPNAARTKPERTRGETLQENIFAEKH